MIPKSFLYSATAISTLSDIKYNELMRNVKKELMQGRVARTGSSQAMLDNKYKGLPLTTPAVEKSNALLIEFVDASDLL